MTFSTGQLAEYVGGSLIGSEDVQCSGASIDSRQCKQGNVFFALQGENVDGHEFIDAAVTAGCSAVIVQQETKATVPVILVSEVRKALYDLAMSRREELPVKKVIAITGSVGKTTTKDILASLLGKHVVSSKKSFNNELGVPLTVLAAESAEYLVAEVGANDVGEIEPLARLVQPDIAILTSIDCAHLDGFGNQTTVLTEKVKLLEALPKSGLAIISENIDLTAFEINATICRVGNSEHADVHIETGIDINGYATLRIGEEEATLSMLGEHNAWNAAFAIVASLNARDTHSLKELMTLVSKVDVPMGRLQKRKISQITFIDDSYNANPASMRSAFKLFQAMKCKRKVMVLGDMLELGEQAHAEHRLLGSLIGQVGADVVILVGPNMEITSQTIPSMYEPNCTEESMKRITALLKNGDTVLLKGSRGLQLERIIELKRQTKVSSL